MRLPPEGGVELSAAAGSTWAISDLSPARSVSVSIRMEVSNGLPFPRLARSSTGGLQYLLFRRLNIFRLVAIVADMGRFQKKWSHLINPRHA